MTGDTDEVDDPFKIEIDKGNKHRRLFEKGLNALLTDPHFLLLYVPRNGAKMQVVQPTNDLYHRRRMIRRINEAEGIPSFYYALSHLWGSSADNLHYWYEIGDYVDNENGNPMQPVSMRSEKRDPLLAMLHDHPDSYWWIDVVCANNFASLGIMGNIYSCCLECIAMIDCEPSLIPQLLSSVEERLFSDKNDMDHYRKLSQRAKLLLKLKQSQWWNRVWTLQEMTLPFGQVCLMAEASMLRHQRNTITVDDLLDKFGDVPYLTLNFERRCIGQIDMSILPELNDWIREISYARKFNKQRIGITTSREFYNLIDVLGNSRRRCYDPVDYVYGVLGMFQFKVPWMSDPVAAWRMFLFELDDYIDQADMRMKITFHGTYIMKISDRARRFDLKNATDLADVYKDLFDEEEYINV